MNRRELTLFAIYISLAGFKQSSGRRRRREKSKTTRHCGNYLVYRQELPIVSNGETFYGTARRRGIGNWTEQLFVYTMDLDNDWVVIYFGTGTKCQRHRVDANSGRFPHEWWITLAWVGPFLLNHCLKIQNVILAFRRDVAIFKLYILGRC